MTDPQIKEAIIAIVNLNQQMAKVHNSLVGLIAQRTPGFSEPERNGILASVEETERKVKQLGAIVAKM